MARRSGKTKTKTKRKEEENENEKTKMKLKKRESISFELLYYIWTAANKLGRRWILGVVVSTKKSISVWLNAM